MCTSSTTNVQAFVIPAVCEAYEKEVLREIDYTSSPCGTLVATYDEVQNPKFCSPRVSAVYWSMFYSLRLADVHSNNGCNTHFAVRFADVVVSDP